jgi:hypothetical protein
MQVQMQPVAEEDRANLGVGDFEPSRNPTGRSASYDEPHGMAVVHLGRPGCSHTGNAIKIAYRDGMIRQVTPEFDDLECAATERGLSPLAPLERASAPVATAGPAAKSRKRLALSDRHRSR